MPVAFASCSIGLPRHTLHQKIEALCHGGFAGIELSFPDLVAFAIRHLGREVSPDDYQSLCEAGNAIRDLCASHGLSILVLQPFSNFEGWPPGSEQREEAFARARGWIDVMEAVGTDLLQVGSSDAPDMITDKDALAADLAALADMLAERGYRLAYENWCWATAAPAWRDVWDLVCRADRPNLGLCLDSFQTAGGEWGDPTTASGRRADLEEAQLQASYSESLAELASTVPAEKIYFVQISDAYHKTPPFQKDGEDNEAPASGTQTGPELRARGRWSHEYRPLPYDGGYLPIEEFTGAILATGFKGWFSIEVFDGRWEEKYGNDLAGFAKKAIDSYQRLIRAASKHQPRQHQDATDNKGTGDK